MDKLDILADWLMEIDRDGRLGGSQQDRESYRRLAAELICRLGVHDLIVTLEDGDL